MSENKPRFTEGEIVRYAAGPTALMKITRVIPDHAGHVRYYGLQYYGDSMGQYEDQLKRATDEEIKQFKTDEHIGRLRDKPELAT